MQSKFFQLLRSNFRCGRMLYSRTVNMAGRVVAPKVRLCCRLRGIAIYSPGAITAFRAFV